MNIHLRKFRYYIFIIGLYICLGVSAQISNDTIRKQFLSLSDCKALVELERGAEALPSLLYYKDTLSREHPLDTIKYTSVICDIIETYLQTDSIIKAASEENAFISIIDTTPSTLAHICSLLGRIELSLYNFNEALELEHWALKIILNNPSIPALEYCKVLENICWIYIRLGESSKNDGANYYLDAKWYIDEAISVFEDKVGRPLEKQGINGLNILYLKAYVYSEIGRREEAIDIYEKIISAKEYNERDVWKNAVNDRAIIYQESGSHDKAIDLFESFSSENPYILLNHARAYYMSDDGSCVTYKCRQTDLRKTLNKANKIFYQKCLDIFSYFAVAKREAYWTENNQIFLLINNLIANKYPEIADVAFDNQLFLRNLNQRSITIINNVLKGSSAEELKNEYGQAQELRDSLTYDLLDNDSIDIYVPRLIDKEMAILNKIPGYKDTLSASFHKWSEIRDSLRDDEIIVDFTLIPRMQSLNDSVYYYGAFVITKEDTIPLLVSLCKKDSIDNYLPKSEKMGSINYLYQNSTPIYTQIWGKLEEYFKECKTIYFIPTLELNLLNHNALIMPDGRLFGEKYNLVRLSSSDKILCRESISPPHQKFYSAVVYGGIKYDLTDEEMKEAAKGYKHQNSEQFLMAMRSDDERSLLDSLPCTRIESHNIDSLLRSKNIFSKLLQDEEANEESFKALSGHSPDIIHLATHGYYLRNQYEVDKTPFMKTVIGYSEKEDQLIFTGVCMAGAKKAWCGKKVFGIEDGVLTADEISRLDLSGTKLVVLSACETAKGFIDEVDGVLGLQRGLKKAGVETIVMSLWQVHDEATSLLMTQFYTYLINGMERHKALWNAMMYVRNKYNEAPYFWAGFVILD